MGVGRRIIGRHECDAPNVRPVGAQRGRDRKRAAADVEAGKVLHFAAEGLAARKPADEGNRRDAEHEIIRPERHRRAQAIP